MLHQTKQYEGVFSEITKGWWKHYNGRAVNLSA